LLNVARANIETLRTWAGELVEVRDSKSRQFYGVFYAVAPIEVYSLVTACVGAMWHVSLELTVTSTEAGS
jgi:hypothetical protein